MTALHRPLFLARLWRPRNPEQAFIRLFELGLAFVAVLGVQKMGTDLADQGSAVLTTGLVLLLATHLFVLVECLRPSRLPWLITLSAAAGIICVTVGQLSEAHSGPTLWRIDAWLGVPLAFLAIIHPRGPKLPLVALTGVGCMLTLAAAGQINVSQHVLATFFTAVQLALLMLARWFAIALLDEHLDSLSARQAHQQRDATTTARTDALTSVRRGMHDSLLHCLQRISSLWSTSTPQQLRDMCADTREQLATIPLAEGGGAASGGSLRTLLQGAVAAEPCDIYWDGDARQLPALVSEALQGAVAEAVRNVVKHCPVADAKVVIRELGQGVRVQVRDAGPGFDTSRIASGRSGLSGSVIDRMAEVGGTGAVDSGPTGTTVTLTWPAPLPVAPTSLGHEARARQSWTPVPLVLGSVANILIHPVPDPATVWIIWSILVGIIIVAALRVRQHGLTDGEAWTLCVIGLVAIICNLFWVDPVGTSAWKIWVPSLTGCLMFLALPGRNIRTAASMATMMLAGALTASIALLGPTATFVSHFGAMMAVLTHVLFTLVLAFGAVAVSRHVHVTRQLEEAVRVRARTAVERESVWREWLHHARHLTDDFLAAIAEGRVDPTAESTRLEASRLEARIRDELRLWPGPGSIAESLDRLRRSGWGIRLDLDSLSPAVRRDLERLLPHVPAPSAGQRMTITQRDGGALVTFSDPGLAPGDLAELEHWVVAGDKDFTQLSTVAAKLPKEVT